MENGVTIKAALKSISSISSWEWIEYLAFACCRNGSVKAWLLSPQFQSHYWSRTVLKKDCFYDSTLAESVDGVNRDTLANSGYTVRCIKD